MKSMKIFLAALLALFLTACAGTASVQFDAEGRITGVTGMDSRDVKSIVNNQNYYAAKKAEKKAPLVHIAAKPGEEVKGLQGITVWNPNQVAGLQAPVEEPHWLVQTFREATGTVKELGKYVLPAYLYGQQQETQREQIKADSANQQAQTEAWGAALNQAQQKPDVVFAAPLPTPTSGTVTTTTPPPAVAPTQ